MAKARRMTGCVACVAAGKAKKQARFVRQGRLRSFTPEPGCCRSLSSTGLRSPCTDSSGAVAFGEYACSTGPMAVSSQRMRSTERTSISSRKMALAARNVKISAMAGNTSGSFRLWAWNSTEEKTLQLR